MMIRNARAYLSRSVSHHQLRRLPKPVPTFHPRPPVPHYRTPIPSALPFHSLSSPTHLGLPTHLPKSATDPRRGYCDDGGSVDYSRDLDEINLKFAVAREDIEDALESRESVYFDEEVECAREAVKVVLQMFDELLKKLPKKEKRSVQRSMGLKMEQLKAELAQLDE